MILSKKKSIASRQGPTNSKKEAGEVVSDLMTPLDIYPECFKVSGFPNEELLVSMGEEL
jgi:hypothetical protein